MGATMEFRTRCIGLGRLASCMGVLALLWVGGCVYVESFNRETTGEEVLRALPRARAGQVTTRDGIIDALGEPQTTKELGGGREILIYEHCTRDVRARWLLGVSWKHADVDVLRVGFELEDGVLVEYYPSVSSGF